MIITVTRHIEFEAAHMLYEYEGACRNLHGHSYKLEVEVAAKVIEPYSFVMDFKQLDSILKCVVPDHMFISNKNLPDDSTERQIAHILKNANMAVKEYGFTPSAENMVAYLASEVQVNIDNMNLVNHPKVVAAKLWETTNSYAKWELDKTVLNYDKGSDIIVNQ